MQSKTCLIDSKYCDIKIHGPLPTQLPCFFTLKNISQVRIRPALIIVYDIFMIMFLINDSYFVK